MDRRVVALFLTVFCAWSVASSIPAAADRTFTTCADVKPIFEMKNISAQLPDKPISGAGLAVCEGTYTCCTQEMETNLRHLVRKDFQALLHHNSRSLEGLLATTATKLQNHVADLTRQSLNKTESVFTQVYENIARLSRPGIVRLYADIASYLSTTPQTNASTVTNPGEPSLDDSVKTFFTDLFPLIYHHAVNPHLRDFSVDYKACLRAAMPEIQPFGEIPRQLSVAVAKTMEATRVLIQALSLGAEVLNSTDMLLNGGETENQECHTALLRMSYCARCQGLVKHVKPCAGYCLNVLRGCLTQHAAELDLPWNGFVEATERLVVAVKGHEVGRGVALDVELLLTTLDSRILEATMYAMETAPELEKKVKRTCGQARWLADEPHRAHPTEGDVAASTVAGVVGGQVPGVTFTQGRISTGPGHGGKAQDDRLATQLHHFLASLTKSRGFYANLAESLCSDESFAETRDTADCWNGKRVGEYTKTVVAASVSAQKYNPELAWSQRSPDPRIAQLSDRLRHIRQVVLSQLTSAPESDSYMSDGEEGSGSGHEDAGWRDGDVDADDDDVGREWGSGTHGSGEGGIESEKESTKSVPVSPQSPSKPVSGGVATSSAAAATLALALALSRILG